MSYSYVKTVFPNFEYSNVYNDKLYSDMSGPTTAAPTPVKILPEPNDENPSLSYLKSEPLIVRPGDQTQLIEKNTFKEPFTEISKDKDNLHFYNQKIETFEGHEHRDESHEHRDEGHDVYLKHVSKCEFCKNMIRKQYHNDQIMELISYITLGIFILILLDRIKK